MSLPNASPTPALPLKLFYGWSQFSECNPRHWHAQQVAGGSGSSAYRTALQSLPPSLFTFAITFCLHGDNGQPIMWEKEGKRERATLPVRCSCHSPTLPLSFSLSVSPPTSIADSNVNCAMLSILFFLFLLGH